MKKGTECRQVHEDQLLQHANLAMRELLRFPALECIAVLCDRDNPESGACWGEDEMHEYSVQIEGEGDQKWPELVCLRDSRHDLDGVCSRHWWFDGWNGKACTSRKVRSFLLPYSCELGMLAPPF